MRAPPEPRRPRGPQPLLADNAGNQCWKDGTQAVPTDKSADPVNETPFSQAPGHPRLPRRTAHAQTGQLEGVGGVNLLGHGSCHALGRDVWGAPEGKKGDGTQKNGRGRFNGAT